MKRDVTLNAQFLTFLPVRKHSKFYLIITETRHYLKFTRNLVTGKWTNSTIISIQTEDTENITIYKVKIK